MINTNTSTSTTATPSFVYHYYLKDHLGNNRVVFHAVNNSPVIDQVNNYYPFGMEYGESAEDQGETTYQNYLFSGKEFDRKFQMNFYDFGARNHEITTDRWMSVDPLCEKYYSISPYVYCANNPMRYVDFNGDSISVSQSITNNFVLNAAFKLFATSKAGIRFLRNYASKGQTLYGHTFTKDGKYDKAGINLNYSSYSSSDPGDKGCTTPSNNGDINIAVNSLSMVDSQDGNTYNWSPGANITSVQAANQMTHGVVSRSMTFFHESFIHADLYTGDYLDNRKMDYSNISPSITSHAKQYGIANNQLQHLQVYWNTNTSTWPGAAYGGLIEINSRFGQRYTNGQIQKMMWNYDGGH